MSKTGKVSPRLPRGFGDRGPAEIAATNAMIEKIRRVYEIYGFEAVETPFFEYTEALGKFLPDTDRPNEGVFSLQDDDEQWMSLRYDLTAPLARYVAENFDRLPKPYRSYRAGYVFRNEKPGPGRFRQFMQFDADTVGSSSIAADAEICMMAADCMEAVGLKGKYQINVNNRKILDGFMDAIQLGGEENAGSRLTVLRTIDKLDKLGPNGVFQLLMDGRKDESGDFTKGANLTRAQADNMLRFLGYSAKVISKNEIEYKFDEFGHPTEASNEQWIEWFEKRVELGALGNEGLSELRTMARFFDDLSYSNRIRINPSVVRGLEYYTGPVFEAELTFTVPDEKGNPIRFGSVGGGGRYDGLVQRFRDEPVPATGFSVGISRLQAALSHLDKAKQRHHGPAVVLVMDKEPEAQARYQQFVSRLRSEGIASEMYLGSAGMNAQLKYADKRNSLVAVIQGSNEREQGKIIVKDLIAGAELASASKTMEREAYLALKERSQMLVDENALIETVRAVMARHA